MDKIVAEQKFNGNINDLLAIYGFGNDFLIGRHWHTKFYVKVGDNNESIGSFKRNITTNNI